MYPAVTIQYHHAFDKFKLYVGAGAAYVNISAVYITSNTDLTVKDGLNLDVAMDMNPVLWIFGFVHKF